MRRTILLTAATLTLIMAGCAQKKIRTLDTSTNVPQGGTTTVSEGSSTVIPATGGGSYQNVDPYGNGTGNGQYTTGDYSVDTPYVSSGIQNIYFQTDQYAITPDQLGIVSHNAKLLKQGLSSSSKVKIEGHCDASGTDEYNYALGLQRAKAAKDALMSNGINPTQIRLVSMGESSPECVSSSSAECYAKNRRVEFKVIR